jgi:hypothetical protein
MGAAAASFIERFPPSRDDLSYNPPSISPWVVDVRRPRAAAKE